MAVVDAAAHVPEDALHEAIDDARAFFRQLADKDGRRERAAPLALLELERVARTKGVGSDFGEYSHAVPLPPMHSIKRLIIP